MSKEQIEYQYPICKECNHYRDYGECGRFPTKVNYATGEQDYASTHIERNPVWKDSSHGCGMEGKMFEPIPVKPSLFRKLIKMISVES